MTTQQQSTRLTYEDYLETPDDERYELIDGELVMVPAPSISHQDVQLDLGAALRAFVRARGLGRIIISPVDVVFSSDNVRQPDIIFVSAERAGIITGDDVQGAPDLAVEILSPSTERADKTTKRETYARHGVKEYWLVDTDARSISVLLLADGDYTDAGTFGPGQTLTSPTLAGLNLDVDEVFQEV